MAELRRAQQRRRQYRVGAVAAVLVIIAVVLIFVTSGGGGKKTGVKTSSSSTTVAGSSTTAPGSTTTATTLPSLTAAGFPAGSLAAHSAPAVETATCNANPTSPSPTTTVKASGKAVSIVPAPAGVGFPKANGSSPRYTKFSTAPPFCIDVNKTYTATITTDAGPITVELLPKAAPLAVNSFVFLAGYHFFDGTVFHRVIPGFVDQGGDPTGSGSGGPGYSFADELPKTPAAYVNGALAMANSGANTNGSQFFIDAANEASTLQASYSVFGLVTGGQSVVAAINKDGASSGTPTKVHHIISVTITAT
jgi:cyclophilin family peptidyl-prolyl cis-trans isomerase